MSALRVIDAGRVSAWRSQALWHGIAAAMQQNTEPTLSLCQPGDPYVGIGYHRSLDELDQDTVARLELPVIRRRIGGGPVYIDSDQLFFQITVPAAVAPRRVDRLYQTFLTPAVEALRRLGLDARLRGLNDIAIGDRRLSGTGAGRIADGVTVVGNVIFRFPHRRMASLLALPSTSMRRECRRLMERHVTSLAAEGRHDLSMEDVRGALVDAYAESLELKPRPTDPSCREEDAIATWQQRFADPEWVTGTASAPPEPRSEKQRQVKISADAWVFAASKGTLTVEASFANGRIDHLAVSSPDLNGTGEAIARNLAGCPISELAPRLLTFGDRARPVLELLETGAVLRH